MRCPSCRTVLAGSPAECSRCGTDLSAPPEPAPPEPAPVTPAPRPAAVEPPAGDPQRVRKRRRRRRAPTESEVLFGMCVIGFEAALSLREPNIGIPVTLAITAVWIARAATQRRKFRRKR